MKSTQEQIAGSGGIFETVVSARIMQFSAIHQKWIGCAQKANQPRRYS